MAFSGYDIPGWDSPPFCVNVMNATLGHFSDNNLNSAAGEVSSLVAQFRDNPFPKLQSKVYKVLNDHRYDEMRSWLCLLSRRFKGFGANGLGEESVRSFIHKYGEALRGVQQIRRRGVAMMAIKTYTNSWATTYR